MGNGCSSHYQRKANPIQPEPRKIIDKCCLSSVFQLRQERPQPLTGFCRTSLYAYPNLSFPQSAGNPNPESGLNSLVTFALVLLILQASSGVIPVRIRVAARESMG